jgi:hypothetical protein
MLSTRHSTLSDEEVGLFYSIADCGVSCADGGALGLCVQEHMAHGIPQVVSNVVAHRALCTPTNSILVNPVVRIRSDQDMIQLVTPSDVAKALETYALSETTRRDHGLAAAAAVAASIPVPVSSLVKRLDLLRQERDIDLAP